jgi:hypothetical protein
MRPERFEQRQDPRSEFRIAPVGTGRSDVREPVVTISRGDTEVIALALTSRLADTSDEDERVAVLQEVIHAARDLHQGMREQTLHALAEYRGTHSAWDVATEGRLVYAALDRYSVTVRRAAARLRHLLGE